MNIDIVVMSIFVVGAACFIYMVYKWSWINVGSQEYLDVLSDYQWMEGYAIKLQIEKRWHGWIAIEDLKASMEKLVSDGLVDERWSGRGIFINDTFYKIREFKRRRDPSPLDMGIPRLNLPTSVRPRTPQLV